MQIPLSHLSLSSLSLLSPLAACVAQEGLAQVSDGGRASEEASRRERDGDGSATETGARRRREREIREERVEGSGAAFIKAPFMNEMGSGAAW